jgi:hypothetical protein
VVGFNFYSGSSSSSRRRGACVDGEIIAVISGVGVVERLTASRAQGFRLSGR